MQTLNTIAAVVGYTVIAIFLGVVWNAFWGWVYRRG